MGRQTFDTRPHSKRHLAKRSGPPLELPGQSIVQKRRKKASLKRHAFGALTLLVGVILALSAYVELYGNPDDAIPQQHVKIDPPAMPAASDTLNGLSGALPDLLEAEVPDGVNPTNIIAQQQQSLGGGAPARDALGNLISPNGGGPSSQDTLVGTAPAAPFDSATPPRGPITINGKVIGGGLTAAPAPGLTRNSPFGKVPARAADGRTAFQVYARPYTAKANSKPVSVMIGGLGINAAITQRAINELPPAVTLAFAAHAPNLQTQIDQARARGHEVVIELPMESADFNPVEPGAEHTLRAGSAAISSNKRNLDWLLSRASGYFAVTNYNGDQFLQRSDNVVPMMASLSEAGLGFLFDGSVSAPSLPTLASASVLPFLKAFSLIDSTPDAASIKAELERITALAQSGQSPVSVGFTYSETIDMVGEWAAGLDAKGLTLVPVSSRMPQRQ